MKMDSNGRNRRLTITQFGNSILRQTAATLTLQEIRSSKIQQLIADMELLMRGRRLGVGLAAPQIGVGLSIALICIQKTALRPDSEDFRLVIINPIITQTFGNKSQLWEGCISGGPGKAGLFAKVPRFRKIELEYYDEHAQKHTGVFEGLPAHVIQHEVDHLNGILFVDKVKDTHTYMTYKEYRKMKLKA